MISSYLKHMEVEKIWTYKYNNCTHLKKIIRVISRASFGVVVHHSTELNFYLCVALPH